jgi:hypothetical protein
MKRSATPRQLSFQSTLERIATDMEYFALPVPEKISVALGTRGPVPVSARVNDSTPFLVSLYTRGGGRHGMRIKEKVRKETKIKEGDRVQVEITVIDRDAVSIPQDLLAALRAAGVEEGFTTLPPGKRNYTIRVIDEAAKLETRAKRIQDAVKAAREKKDS